MSDSGDRGGEARPRAKGKPEASPKKPAKATLAQDIAKEVKLTRRLLVSMLFASAGAGTAAAQNLAKQTVTSRPDLATQGLQDKLILQRPPVFSNAATDLDEFYLLRPEDLLNLHIRLVNLKVTGPSSQRRIEKADVTRPALMVVEFPPQAIAESVFPDKSGSNEPAIDKDGGKDPSKLPTPVAGPPGVIGKGTTAKAYISGPSRLAFRMPDGITTLPFTATDVLNACASWRLNLAAKSGTVPPVEVEGHAFDRILDRLSLIVDDQKSALHAYGTGVEALLTRAAKRVSDAIATAAGQGNALSDASIDQLIKHEIKLTLTPNALSDIDLADPPLVMTPNTLVFKNYVSAVAVQNLAYMVRPQASDQTHSPLEDQGSSPNRPTLQNRTVRQGQGALQNSTLDGVRETSPIYHWQDLDPTVIATLPPGSSAEYRRPRPIDANATDLEIPFRLHMTPLSTAGFTHASEAVDHGSAFTELWHTRMGTRVSDWILSENPEPIRALYTDDFSQPSLGQDWSLLSEDREDLVHLMQGHSIAEAGGYMPRPAIARHLRLTALGGSMEAEGVWPDHLMVGSDIVQWKHVTSIGRDQFVRVIYEGYLFPFGHAAALIKVSERKFSRQTEGGRVAGLMQKFFIIVREKTRSFPGIGQKYDGRDFPFTSVEITTKQTPDLAAPSGIAGISIGDETYKAFWPALMASGSDMTFHLVGTDSQGRKSVFEIPLMFVSGTFNADGSMTTTPDTALAMVAGNSKVEAIALHYNLHANLSRRTVALKKALIRFSVDTAPNGSVMGTGESDYHASQIIFKSWKAQANIKGPRFYPSVDTATIEVPSVKHLLGNSVQPIVNYHQRYLDHGFDLAKSANPAQMVFGFAKQTISDKATDKFGGLLTPSLAPDGLSRKLGALTNSAAIEAGTFDPLSAIPTDAKLLGVVPLGAILHAVDDLTGSVDTIPHLKTETSGSAVTTTYTVTQKTVKPFSAPGLGDIFVPLDVAGGQDQLTILTKVVIAKSGQKPETSVNATLLNFKINLFGFIILNFDKLAMTVAPGQKPDIDPVLNPKTGLLFGGPLEFVNSLRDVIPMNGFSDPPGIDVTPNGITASYSLSLPDIGVGAMSLQNVSLGAGFDLPFTSDGPSARFNFAERHNPFNLTISLFGGGGFFAISIDTKGVRELEMSLEFGAQISIDLGVASGGVYVKAGFYFHWEDHPVATVGFSAYIELGGHLSVLGIITVSLTFHLELAYEKTGGHSRLYGTATLTVEIDILFFSISQDVTVERQFAGSDADPAFLDFVPNASVWNTYCDAYA